mmetsp:Transcript_45309/g.73513  ORF Transcript_45309/g.73513 Transcript_45309/m.73513 type:complete len:241 (-) Transcript_45309:687-1409(-)
MMRSVLLAVAGRLPDDFKRRERLQGSVIDAVGGSLLHAVDVSVQVVKHPRGCTGHSCRHELCAPAFHGLAAHLKAFPWNHCLTCCGKVHSWDRALRWGLDPSRWQRLLCHLAGDLLVWTVSQDLQRTRRWLLHVGLAHGPPELLLIRIPGRLALAVRKVVHVVLYVFPPSAVLQLVGCHGIRVWPPKLVLLVFDPCVPGVHRQIISLCHTPGRLQLLDALLPPLVSEPGARRDGRIPHVA